MSEEMWVRRWGFDVAPTPIRPGLYRLKGGGFLARVTAVDPRTKEKSEQTRVLHDANLPDATRLRAELQAELRKNLLAPKSSMPLFAEFAASLFEAKVAKGRIKSAAGKSKFEGTLRLHLIPTFGRLRLDEITHGDVERWFLSHAPMVQAETLSPRTVNGWMRTLRMILAAAAPRFGINNPSKGIDLYSEANRPTYSYEEPNSLTAEELPTFLQTYFERYPQHYALAFLGFVTGLRPSMLVPLRRQGPKTDVLWDENAILIRRSYTEGDESDVMDMTKSGARYRIGLPEQSMAVLRWHVATQIAPGPQEESDLLFPSTLGTLRHGETLQKPFAKVAKACGFKKHISPKAMRRTFQDLCRAAEVEGVVTRSISGHATSAMTEWYSTVHADEQRAAVGKVLSLFDRVRVPGETAPGVGSGVGSKLPTPKTG